MVFNGIELTIFWELNIDKKKDGRIKLQGKSASIGPGEVSGAYLSCKPFKEDLPERAQ